MHPNWQRTIGGARFAVDGGVLTCERTAASRSCIIVTTVSLVLLLLCIWSWLLMAHPLRSLSSETADLEALAIIGLPVFGFLIVGALAMSLRTKPIQIDKYTGYVSRGDKIIARIDQCRTMTVRSHHGGESQDSYSIHIELWTGKRINLASTIDLHEATDTAKAIGEWLQIGFRLD